ncbi:MAG: hypothetical protein Kow001_05230 [Acidobacteriota bacterium]
MAGLLWAELAGFFLGVLVHTFLLWVVWRRRPRTSFERLLAVLLAALVVWFSGNFINALLRRMGPDRAGSCIQWVDIFSFAALALLPAVLLHTHWHYFHQRFPGRGNRLLKVLIVLLYGSLALVPAALTQLATSPELGPIEKLGRFRLPFLGLLASAYAGSVFLQAKIVRGSRDPVEGRLFRILIPMFVVIPLYSIWVFEWGPAGGTARVIVVDLALMASLFPSLAVAYFIWRYRFLQIDVHRGLALALAVLAGMAVYLWGIRSLVSLLEPELGLSSLALEAVLLAALLFMFPAASRWLQDWAGRDFSGEMSRFRDLAERIHAISLTTVSVDSYRRAVEELLQRELPSWGARLVPPETTPPEGALPLRSGRRLLGWLQWQRPEPLSPGSREGGLLLSREIAAALDRCEMLERHLAMQRELSRKSRLEELGRMAASVAHSVKNPLSSIKTLLQLRAESAGVSEEEKAEIRMMIHEVDRLARTVTDLLRFSRSEKPTAGAREWVDLRSLVEGTLGLFRGRLEEKGLSVQWEVSGDHLGLESDRAALTEVISNLVVNAVEASPPGGSITIDVSPAQDGLEIGITDQGPGIAGPLRDKVFDPFVTTKATGTGLGLTISRRRVEELGGSLRLEDGPSGAGTRAVVYLPAVERTGGRRLGKDSPWSHG